MSIIKIENKEQFANLIMNNQGYSFVDFSASWCGPCKRIYPKLEEYSKSYPLITFLYVDIDLNKELSDIYKISSVPTFLVFRPNYFLSVFEPIQGANVSKIETLLDIIYQNIITNQNNDNIINYNDSNDSNGYGYI